MKTVLNILNRSIQYLEQHGIQNARREAQLVIGDALQVNPMQLYLDFERPLDDDELDRCRQNLARRASGEPSQYIRGEVDFLGCVIKVNRDVLIPRQETEILADKIVQELASEGLSDKVLWDVCCGSGCLGIAIKKKYPQLSVVLSDLFSAALCVAKENAQLNKAELSMYQGNLLEPFKGEKADFVVCNPPYIAEGEKLDREVREYEPQQALVAGPTGLEFYERLAQELPAFLNPGARVWLEIGYRQGAAVLRLFERNFECRLEQDWSGHDRFVLLHNRHDFLLENE